MLCAVMLLVGLMSPGRACEGPAAETRVVNLGFGELAINLPASWHIDEGTVYIEIVKYTVARADGSAALTITMSAAPSRQYLGTSARPYCTNGLRGETETKDDQTMVRLDIPPPPDESRRSDNAAYLRFRAGDADAAAIVASARVPWVSPRCPDSR
jgi:hypothetical protein